MMHRSSQQQGFTLIELLIAMSLSAIIIVLSYQAISQASQIESLTSEKAEHLKQLQRAFWWLEKDVTQVVPRSVKGSYDDRLAAFALENTPPDASQLEFTRIAKGQSPYSTAGLLRVGYQLENQTLYRIIWPVLDRAPDTEAKKIPVLHNVTGFRVRVLDSDKRWQLDWPPLDKPKTELPQMVEITLSFDNHSNITRLFPVVDNLNNQENQNEQ